MTPEGTSNPALASPPEPSESDPARKEREAEAVILAWVAEERAAYAHQKWARPGATEAHLAATHGTGPTRWEDWAGDYIKRAVMFGIDTPQGRQALGKAISTLVHFLATAVVEYGPMPKPGVPSGVIE